MIWIAASDPPRGVEARREEQGYPSLAGIRCGRADFDPRRVVPVVPTTWAGARP